MAVTVDTFMAGKYSTDGYDAGRRVGAGGANHAATSSVYGKAVIGAFIDQKLAMTNADLPQGDRWAVVPPELLSGLERYFLLEQDASGVWLPATQEQTLRNGFAGTLVGFSLYVSKATVAGTAISSKATKRCVLGQGSEAVTIANQIVENEAYRPERRFGDAVKGLMVYGAKNVLPASGCSTSTCRPRRDRTGAGGIGLPAPSLRRTANRWRSSPPRMSSANSDLVSSERGGHLSFSR